MSSTISARRLMTVAVVALGAFAQVSLAAAQRGYGAPDQAITWTSNVNVAIRGNMVQKIRGCDGCQDAGAVSREMIRSGDGYVEFRVGDPYAFWLAGLKVANVNRRFNQIDYAFRFNGNGWADVLENGSYQPNSDIEASAGDTFALAVVRGRVQFIRNGRLIYESRRAPRYPLVFAAALGSMRASVANVRIGIGSAAMAMRDRYGNPRDQYGNSRDQYGNSRDQYGNSRDQYGNPRDQYRDPRDQYGSGRQGDARQGVGTSGRQTVVDPRKQWTETGLWVQAGDTIAFDASGTIRMSTDTNDTASPSGSSRQAPQAPIRSSSAGTLIAKIGDSAPIAVGSHGSARAPVSGQVFLGINDDFLPDNTGEYDVTVSVQSR